MSYFKTEMIAYCGMNCGICIAFLRKKKKCHGCRKSNLNRGYSKANCGIKMCCEKKKAGIKYCFNCDGFPCDRIKRMDKRYRTKYEMSMIENLKFIKEKGIRNFLKSEAKIWLSLDGKMVYCVHNKKNYNLE
jgi:hypothetical protein